MEYEDKHPRSIVFAYFYYVKVELVHMQMCACFMTLCLGHVQKLILFAEGGLCLSSHSFVSLTWKSDFCTYNNLTDW